MLKLLYRIIILVCIFVGSIYYFGRDMEEAVFNVDKTVEMSETSFPVIRLLIGETIINQQLGYSNNISANMVRESITPITDDQSFTVLIDEKENVVKRVIYEIRDVRNNKLLESDTINALEKLGEEKSAKIRIKQTLDANVEYAVKITLVTSESRKMNFYTRVKKMNASYYNEKLDFIMNFHESTLDKDRAESIIAYLEPNNSLDNSSYSYVNINSSFELIHYGDLAPKVVSTIIPTITDINTDMAMVELKYVISVDTDYGQEFYNVRELFRVRYTSQRMYLLNYERSMETLFNINHLSLTKNEFKIGISNNPDMNLFTSSNNSKLAFVRERELMYYNLAENHGVKVFSFIQEDTDYVRDNNSEHDVKILNMDDDGNISFMVYGYMNRGVYEGRVGMVLYQYYSGENRIEELVYIPMNIPYQILKEQINSFSYINKQSIFYFAMNNSIYSYNLITKGLTTIATDISDDNFVYSKELHYIAYQDNSDPKKTSSVIVLDLETGNRTSIKAPDSNSNINLLGNIDNNIIYGFVESSDIGTKIDGTLLIPMYQVEIADKDGKILKQYHKEDYYVTSVTVNNNIITLERMTKVHENGKAKFLLVESDNILNKVINTSKPIYISKRITDRMKTEYYISLPTTYKLEAKPSLKYSVNTIINEDTTVRLLDIDNMIKDYVVYSYGNVVGMFDTAGDAVKVANEKVGSVVNKNQSIIWERIIRSNTMDINNITKVNAVNNINSLKASADMLITYRYGNVNLGNESVSTDSIKEYLGRYFNQSLLNLTGASLNEMLYYVSLRRPVIAMKSLNEAVLIVGYDQYNITVYDPNLSRLTKIGLKDSTTLFENAGNIFFTYINE